MQHELLFSCRRVFVTALFVVSFIVGATTMTGTTKTPFVCEGNDFDDDNTIKNQQRSFPKNNIDNENDNDNLMLENRTENAEGESNSISNSSSSNIYESPDVEWCRRRPTWRKAIQDDDDNDNDMNTSNNDSIRNRCRKALGYHPDLEQLTKFKDPLLSSTFDTSVDFDFENHYYDKYQVKEHEYPETYHQLPVLERPILRKLSACMDRETQQLHSSSNTTTTTNKTNDSADVSTTGIMKKARVSELYHRDRDQMTVMGIVENALTENEAEAVVALATCARLHIPLLFEARGFGLEDNDLQESGGNDVTYLAGFMQLLAPGVASSIQKAAGLVWKEAKWEHDETNDFVPVDVWDDNDEETTTDTSKYSTKIRPDPVVDCGIRTTEHLSYDKWKGLGQHVDSDSDYTVLVALSDPDDYQGGGFSLCPENYLDLWRETVDEAALGGPDCLRKITVKPNRLSAIVFLSNFMHGVEDIKTSGRVTFANELWRYGNVPAMGMRPSPSMYVLGTDEDNDDSSYDNDDDSSYDDDDENDYEDDDEEDTF